MNDDDQKTNSADQKPVEAVNTEAAKSEEAVKTDEAPK